MAEIGQTTVPAAGILRFADLSAEKDDSMAKVGRGFGCEQCTQILLHFKGVFGGCQSQPIGDADKMSVGNNGGLMVHIPQNQIGRFSADSGQG